MLECVIKFLNLRRGTMIFWTKYVDVEEKKRISFILFNELYSRDFSVKSKLIISLFQTVKLSFSISLFQNLGFREIILSISFI